VVITEQQAVAPRRHSTGLGEANGAAGRVEGACAKAAAFDKGTARR
jgi:hypothetical protein